jgi:hypothetical protein
MPGQSGHIGLMSEPRIAMLSKFSPGASSYRTSAKYRFSDKGVFSRRKQSWMLLAASSLHLKAGKAAIRESILFKVG